ncbi:MAG: hypothetical protein ACKVJF_07175 [Flavobacteriales bacterium]
MAEIKIKKKSPVWPWMLLVLVVLAVIAYYFMTSDGLYTEDERSLMDQDDLIENETGYNYPRLVNFGSNMILV